MHVDIGAAGICDVLKSSSHVFVCDLEPSASLISCFSQTHERIDDSSIFAGRWVDEQSILSKADDGRYGSALSY
jgi:hypothetical protein